MSTCWGAFHPHANGHVCHGLELDQHQSGACLRARCADKQLSCSIADVLGWQAAQFGCCHLQQDWAQGHGDDERSSSDGRGSSYFSGERLDHIHSPMHSQQSLSGHGESISLVSPALFHLTQSVYAMHQSMPSTRGRSQARLTLLCQSERLMHAWSWLAHRDALVLMILAVPRLSGQ